MFLWFFLDLTNQIRYLFVRTEIWYRWMILSWFHVPINSFGGCFWGISRRCMVIFGRIFIFFDFFFWKFHWVWAFGIVRFEFAAENCVRTIQLNDVHHFFFIFCRLWCCVVCDGVFCFLNIVSTIRLHDSGGLPQICRIQFLNRTNLDFNAAFGGWANRYRPRFHFFQICSQI